MVRTTFLGASLALLAFTGTAFSQERVVNVLNWSDYIEPSILEDFTKETGIKVVYDVFDSNEILETKLLAGGSGYDIVVPTGTFLSRQIQAGVFQKLDKAKLPNLKNMWDQVSKTTAEYDPGNEYSINYMWGTSGIGYNKAKIKERLGVDTITSWKVVLDAVEAGKLADCGIHMLDSATDILPIVLNYVGANPNSTEEADLAKAEELMLKIRPSVRKFHSSEFINALANGDICVAVGFSGDIIQAATRAAEAKQGVEIAYAIPTEGTIMWFDQMAIPSDAKNVDTAHEFINYIMRPDVAAKASNFIAYANGNKASQEFIDKAVIGDPTIYPDDATMSKLFTTKALDARETRAYTDVWTKVLTGQ
jgi:putrescine transport system substrate-binding protein